MSEKKLSVREFQENDIAYIIEYWMNSKDSFLMSMGVDLTKIPPSEQMRAMLIEQLHLPITQKQSYCIIWLLDGQPIGHSNVNKISFGKEAFMHLHIWDETIRKKGYGDDYIKLTLPYFFNNLQLKKLCCEPYALNTAPNKTLEKAGFHFIKEYITIPGSLNFEQPVRLWEMSLESYRKMY